jgi:hypothetical protein
MGATNRTLGVLVLLAECTPAETAGCCVANPEYERKLIIRATTARLIAAGFR